jgi:hypothetical protein
MERRDPAARPDPSSGTGTWRTGRHAPPRRPTEEPRVDGDPGPTADEGSAPARSDGTWVARRVEDGAPPVRRDAVDRPELDRPQEHRLELDRSEEQRAERERVVPDRGELDWPGADRSQWDQSVRVDRNRPGEERSERAELARVDRNRPDPERPERERAELARVERNRSGQDRPERDRTEQERAERGDRREQRGSRGRSDSAGEPEEREQGGTRAPAAAALRRFRPRSWRGAIGLGIVGAAALLFLFVAFDAQARWWVPVAAGLVVLVLLSLLRLDRLLKGWTWHVAGIAMLAGLVHETAGNPWSWAFAASIGVLIAGLLRLPRWQLAAVGAALCVVSFVGYQFRAAEVRAQEAQIAQQAGTQMRQGFGYDRPELVLTKLGEGLTPADPEAVCRLLDPAAQTQLAQATGTADCTAGVGVAASRVSAGSPTAAPRASTSPTPVPPPGTVVAVDGCAATWGRAVPTLGTVDVVRTDNTAKATWRVASFRPCP